MVSQLQATIEDMPRNNDLKLLYNKIMPHMEVIQKDMIKYSDDYQRFRKVLARYDQLFAEKANKITVK